MPTLTLDQLGYVVFALILLSRWLWDYNRARREEGGQYEPKATPPLHKEYVTRTEVEKIERTLKDDLTKQAGARKEMHKEISDLQGDVKVLQATTDAQTRQLGNIDVKMDQVLMRLPRQPQS